MSDEKTKKIEITETTTKDGKVTEVKKETEEQKKKDEIVEVEEEVTTVVETHDED